MNITTKRHKYLEPYCLMRPYRRMCGDKDKCVYKECRTRQTDYQEYLSRLNIEQREVSLSFS